MPITNTYTTSDAAGIREDLANVIHNISPEDTPFQSNVSRGKCSNTLFEWQTDELETPDSGNAVAEGADVTDFDAVTPTIRLQNRVQISRKTVIVAGSLESVDKAGRKRELSYQMAKRGSELKRDIETIALSNQAASGGAVRTTGSVLAFLKTNVDHEGTGANPTYSTIPDDTRTDGTQREFTEAMLKGVVQDCWSEGATPKIVMVGGRLKQKVSSFPGIADQRYNASGDKPTTIIGAADVYVSDFGNLSVVPNRFMRDRDALVLDPEYAEMAYLRPYRQHSLAKTGDAEKRMVLVEWGVKVKQEKAHGLVADLDPAV